MKAIQNFFFPLLVMLGLNCQAQKVTSSSFNFNEITFHSSPCNGTCPDISLNIRNDSSISLVRTLYLKKGVEDTVRSGAFKGTLSPGNYKKLMELLNEVKWDSVEFPNIMCCDKPVIQILLTYNNRMRSFKSMQPPLSTQKLIDFLTQLSMTAILPRYDKGMDFDAISD